MKLFYSTILVLFIAFQLQAKNTQVEAPKIKGVVYETIEGENRPVPFANVMCKGTTIGTFAGTEGNFSLNLVEGKHTIVISCVGYEPLIKTVKVKKGKNSDLFNIELKPSFSQTAYKE